MVVFRQGFSHLICERITGRESWLTLSAGPHPHPRALMHQVGWAGQNSFLVPGPAASSGHALDLCFSTF